MSPHVLQAHHIEILNQNIDMILCKKCLIDACSVPTLSQPIRTTFEAKIINQEFVSEVACEAKQDTSNLQSNNALHSFADALGIDILHPRIDFDAALTTLKPALVKLLQHALCNFCNKAAVEAVSFFCAHKRKIVACGAVLGMGELLRRFYFQLCLNGSFEAVRGEEIGLQEPATETQGGGTSIHGTEYDHGWYDLRSGPFPCQRY